MTEPDGTQDGPTGDAEPQVDAADAAQPTNGDTPDAATAGSPPDAADPPGASTFIDDVTKHSDPPGAAIMMDRLEFSSPSTADFVVPTSAEPDDPSADNGASTGSPDEGSADADAAADAEQSQ